MSRLFGHVHTKLLHTGSVHLTRGKKRKVKVILVERVVQGSHERCPIGKIFQINIFNDFTFLIITE